MGDVFLKIDADQSRADVEVQAMAMAPLPTPEIRWRKPTVLALAALSGKALGRLANPQPRRPPRGLRPVPPPGDCTMHPCRPGPSGAWASSRRVSTPNATGCSPTTSFLPPSSTVTVDLPRLHSAVDPCVLHGDLQVAHVFVDDDQVTGVIDSSDACQGDALFDLAVLTLDARSALVMSCQLQHRVVLDVIRAWWALEAWWRSAGDRGWLDPSTPGCELAVLQSAMSR